MSQIRGTSIHFDPAPQSVTLFARSFDLWLGLALGLAFLAVRSQAPAWGWDSLAAVAGISAGLAVFSRILFACTLGEWILDLRPHTRFSYRLDRRITPLPRLVAAGVGYALLCFGIALWISERVISHPILTRALLMEVDPYLPPATGWNITPFYYALLATPLQFQKEPVLYGLIYQKGPPQVFIDHFTAYWDFPEVTWTIEGPKTPLLQGQAIARENLQTCLIGWGGWDTQCREMRQNILERHIREMRTLTGATLTAEDWSLRWFNVANAALGSQEMTQGIFIQARGRVVGETRYIFVSPSGRHQAIALRAPVGQAGDAARALFHQIAASARISDSLVTGKLWSEQQLKQVRTSQIRNWEEWSRVFALLLARVSVDPNDRQAYYHLGGVAHSALRLALRGHPIWVKGLAEMLLACEKYLADLAPESPEHRSIRLLAVDADKALKGERF